MSHPVIQALLIAFNEKSSAGDNADAVEPVIPPPGLKDRFELLLRDASRHLSSGLLAPPVTAATPVEPTEAATPAAASSGSEQPDPFDMALTVENVGAVEGVFDTGVGTDVENEKLCLFLRGAMTAPTRE